MHLAASIVLETYGLDRICDRRRIRVGTICSGVGALYFALRSLFQVAGVRLQFEDAMVCDKNTRCLKFLRQNFGSQRSEGFCELHDVLSEHFVSQAVGVDVLGAGWVCTNNSRENWFTREPQSLDASRNGDAMSLGESSRTLRATLDYIIAKVPVCILLENVYSDSVIAALHQCVLELASHNLEYELGVFVLQARDWGLPTKRERIHAVLVRQHAARKPPAAWGTELARCRDALVEKPLRFEDCHILSPPERAPFSGRCGRDWKTDHQCVRAALQEECGIAVPSGEGLSPWIPGAARLTARERDLLGITCYAAKMLANVDLVSAPAQRRVILDLTPNIFRVRDFRESADGRIIMPCILRNHRYFDMARHQVVAPQERLFAMGFPRDVNLAGLKQNHISDLAGNTQSLRVVVALLGAVFKYVDFDAPIDRGPLPEWPRPESLVCDLRVRRRPRPMLPGMKLPGADHPLLLARRLARKRKTPQE